MSQFPKSGFLARAATSSAAAATRASLRAKPTNAPSSSSSSPSRRTSHSHPNPPPPQQQQRSASPPTSPSAPASGAAPASASSSSSSSSVSTPITATAPGANSSLPYPASASSHIHISEAGAGHQYHHFEPYGPHLPGHAAGIPPASGPSPSSSSSAAAIPIPIGSPISSLSNPASPTFVSIGVHLATSSSNVFGPSSAPAVQASFASALTTVAPTARRPFNFWPQAVVTSSSTSSPSATASGYAAAAAAAQQVQTVTSPLLGSPSQQQQQSSPATPTPAHAKHQSNPRPSPADIFLSSLNSDFDPSLPWSAGSSTPVDWLSSSLASTRIQSSVSWEGRNALPGPQHAYAQLHAAERSTPVPSASKRSRTASSAQWRRPPPINFDTTIANGENWNASFSSNHYRAPDGSFVEGPALLGSSGSGSGSSSTSGSGSNAQAHAGSSSSSSQHQQGGSSHHQQHQQHHQQHGRSPPPHPNPYPSNTPSLGSTGALITRPPSSGSSSTSSSSPFNASSSLSQAAAAASSNANSTPLNGNGFGAPGGISARAFSIPPQSHTFGHAVDPQFHFEHGAYGIPKRHPLASVQRKRRKADAAGKERSSSVAGGAAGFFAAAASTLVGGVTSNSTLASAPKPTEEVKEAAVPSPNFTNATSNATAADQAAAAASQKLVDEDAATYGTAAGTASNSSEEGAAAVQPPAERRRPRGIRENGRIVHDRLRSVQVGEDAYFLREDALGVADGVGGWASRPGADPALFSRLLMHFCSVELSRFDSLSSEELAAKDGAMLRRWAHVDPVEILHCAWHRCVRAARREGIIGSSTALVAVLRGDELRIANVGDCVLLIIRQGDLLFRSTEQQHSFNFPVQLGMMGDTVESVAEELQRRKEAKEKAAAAEAAGGEKGEGAAAGSGKTGENTEEEDTDDEPIPDGVDYTIDGHGNAQSMDASGDSAQSGAKGVAGPEGKGASKPFDTSGEVSASSSDANDEESEVEWDEPRRDAGRWSVKVEPGDVIIIGSDGLVDNLFDEDILEEVLRFAPAPPEASGADAAVAADGEEGAEKGAEDGAEQEQADRSPFGTWLPPDFSPQLVSEALCSRAKAVSEDSRALYSPFQQRAVTEGLHYVGGKLDDISVLVAVVGAHNVGTDNEGKLFVSSQSLHSYPTSTTKNAS
ncbi:hypothetical protein OC835_005325 [Tilletia horrida]|nr:hypothetical protein OC835_005325 [Tilletia horrida]